MSRFIVMPARILADERLSSATHLRVLMYLGLCADKHGWCFPSRRDVAARVGRITPARVSQCMRDLSDWGYVEVHAQSRDSDGGQTSNAYRILFDIGEPVAQTGEDGSTPVSTTNPPVSQTNPSKKRSTRVSRANPPVSPADMGGKSHGVIRGGKSLAFTPVVNDPSNDPNKKTSSSSNARETSPVDNSKLLPPLPSNEKPTAEQSLVAWLAGLPRCVIDPVKDRVRLLTWVGKGLTREQMTEAHRRALVARDRDDDKRPVYASFLARFVDEVVSVQSAPTDQVVEGDWWTSASGADAQGAKVDVARRKDEPNPDYLVRVAHASGRGPWIDHVLAEARKGNEKRFHQIVQFFGDALMPADFT